MTDTEWLPLSRSSIPLTSSVVLDELTAALIEPFDFSSAGESEFFPFEVPPLPAEFGLGVIVGASGSGKSTLLKSFGVASEPVWDASASVASHFNSVEDALEKLSAAGLMSLPEWVKPYSALSNGQRFRADLARSLHDGAVIDEFTSVVDRNVAKSASVGLSRYVRKNGVKNVVVASCHRDILEFLEPDWIIDTDLGAYTIGRSLRRPELVLEVYPCSNSVWSHFAPYHYLTESLNKASHCYLAVWEGQLVGFYSVMSLPSGTLKGAYRGHRLVIHPDYQGFGFGHTLAETVAQHYIDNGKRFFAKTAHPRLGEYRDNSDMWRATSKNHKKRTDARNGRIRRWKINPDRWTYSHEYVGDVSGNP
jgi:GNAT superfamily N-acetyltransferase